MAVSSEASQAQRRRKRRVTHMHSGRPKPSRSLALTRAVWEWGGLARCFIIDRGRSIIERWRLSRGWGGRSERLKYKKAPPVQRRGLGCSGWIRVGYFIYSSVSGDWRQSASHVSPQPRVPKSRRLRHRCCRMCDFPCTAPKRRDRRDI